MEEKIREYNVHRRHSEGDGKSKERQEQKITHLTVLPASNFTNDLVVFLAAPVHSQRFIIPIFLRSIYIDFSVYPIVNGAQGKSKDEIVR